MRLSMQLFDEMKLHEVKWHTGRGEAVECTQ
jgi:hypothetical protein